MKVTTDVRQRVVARIEKCLEDAATYYGRTFKKPKILFTKRGTTAGTASYKDWTVNFNPILLMENQDAFIDRTVPHEMAHLIDYTVNPHNFETSLYVSGYGHRRTKRTVHGADFKFIMERVLGASDSKRCHTYDVSNARVKKAAKTTFDYRCTCGCNEIFQLGPKRHKKEQMKPGTFWIRGHQRARLELVTTKPAPSVRSVVTPAAPASHNRGSNKDNAARIFVTTTHRAQFIEVCVKELGMKETTASTYHHNFKSGKWSV